MTKYIITITAFVLSLYFSNAQSSSAYQVPFSNAAGRSVSMAGFAGKKVIVVVCSAASPDLSRLVYLDSLQKKNATGTAVLVVPVQDFDAGKTIADIQKSVTDSLKLGVTVGQAGYGQKTAAASQNKLLQWLTTASLNSHFDYDLTSLQQVFVLSETGRLFAVMQGPKDLGLYITDILASKVPDK